VWHLHEFGLEDQGLSFLFGARFSMSLINRLSSQCICVSFALAKKFAPFIEPSKITVIYPSMHRALMENGVPPQSDGFVHPRGKQFRCVIVGALIKGKGQQDAVLAVSCLKKAGVATELLIAGGGDSQYRHELEELVRANGLESDVSFVGQLKSSRLLMLSSDVVLVCSRSEAFGRVTIEGMHAGRPVIGARSAATAELIKHGINGLLYTPGDPADLAEKIMSIYKDPRLGVRLSENATTWVGDHFRPNRYTDALCKLIESLPSPRPS
jgi:glycosyltransferase involved in cell wall biosynthesis